MSQQKKVCPTCGQSVHVFGHRLTDGLVNGLMKFKQAVLFEGKNDINPSTNMKGSPWELTFNERSNWSKLRFHGLVAKVYNKDGSRKQGHWLLTKKGNDFLKGASVPAVVYTLKNHVEGHSVEQVTIRDVIGREPHFEDIHTIEYRDVAPATVAQPTLIPDN